MKRYVCLILASAVIIATGGFVLDGVRADPFEPRGSAGVLALCVDSPGGDEPAEAEVCADEDAEDLLRHEPVSHLDRDPVMTGLAERSTGNAGRSPRSLYRPPRALR